MLDAAQKAAGDDPGAVKRRGGFYRARSVHIKKNTYFLPAAAKKTIKKPGAARWRNSLKIIALQRALPVQGDGRVKKK
jgi:hypothetical protein